MDCIIKNGTIVTAHQQYNADILVRDGSIAAISKELDIRDFGDVRIIDAKGCYVMPGGVDAHVHMSYPIKGYYSADDFHTGSIAAAAGGTTTLICMINPPEKLSLHENIHEWEMKAKDRSVVDYSFHQTINRVDEDILSEIPELIKEGYPSFKVFLGTANSVSDYGILMLMDTIKRNGGQILVNGGNAGIEKFLLEKLNSEERKDIKNYGGCSPEMNEVEGVSRVIKLASIVGIPIYVVHVSCFRTYQEILDGRMRGVSITAETCPQYLTLFSDNYLLPDNQGVKYTLNPPLRGIANRDNMWKSLDEGGMEVVSSDHCPFNFADKEYKSRVDFMQIPNGLPGVETRIPLMYNEGVRKGRISINRMVQVVSTNPAKHFGLYPQKGDIAVGSDADIVIFDPNSSGTISYRNLHQNIDYSPYEGCEYCGAVRDVLVRGRYVIENGEYKGESGYGRYIRRFGDNNIMMP